MGLGVIASAWFPRSRQLQRTPRLRIRLEGPIACTVWSGTWQRTRFIYRERHWLKPVWNEMNNSQWPFVLEQAAANTAHDAKEKFYWIDFVCIDQRSPSAGIGMLPLYLANCDNVRFSILLLWLLFCCAASAIGDCVALPLMCRAVLAFVPRPRGVWSTWLDDAGADCICGFQQAFDLGAPTAPWYAGVRTADYSDCWWHSAVFRSISAHVCDQNSKLCNLLHLYISLTAVYLVLEMTWYGLFACYLLCGR